MADLQAAYRALPEDERRILRVLSVICEPIGQTVFQQVLDRLGWRDRDGAPLSRRMDKALRERLLDQGPMEQRKNSLICHPDLLEPLTRETVADGTFAEIVKAAEPAFPTQQRTWEPTSDERRFRLVRIALYGGDEKKVLEILGLTGAAPASQIAFHTVEPLARACTHPTDPDWLEALEPRLRILALVPMLREATHDLVVPAGPYELMERLLTPLAVTNSDAAKALAEQRLLSGRVTEATPLLAGHNDPEGLALQGWLGFLQGDYGRVIASVEAGELFIRKLTRKRNLYTPGIPGALYLLALLRRGERADFERVQHQVSVCLRASVSDPIERAYRILGDLAAVVAGQRRVAECGWLRDNLTLRGAFPTLFQALALHWLGERPPADLLPALARRAREAAVARFRRRLQGNACASGSSGTDPVPVRPRKTPQRKCLGRIGC